MTSLSAVAVSAAPIGTHQTRLVDRNGQANEFFGGQGGVAVDRNTIVIGAPGHHAFRGAAFVYQRRAPASTRAKQVATLVASDGAPLDHFGRGVAVAGNMIVVAAPDHDFPGATDRGAVYVFVMPKHGWSGVVHESAVLIAGDGNAGDELGFDSVAVSGGTVVVGANQHQVGANTQQGAVYVFTRPRKGWSGHRAASAELTASDGGASDRLGAEGVGIAGRTVVAGAGGHAVGGHAQQGAVYVFSRPHSGWAGARHEGSELTAAQGVAGDYLGGAGVATSGGTIVAQSTDKTIHGKSDAGMGYVFVRPNHGWPAHGHEAAHLFARHPQVAAGLGHGLAISGKTIVASAPGQKVGHHRDQGVIDTFTMPKHGWSGNRLADHTLAARDGRKNDELGYQSLAIWHTTVVAGDDLHRVGSNTYQGAAYIFAP